MATELSSDGCEARLSDFWSQRHVLGLRMRRYLPHDLWMTLQAVRDILSLPEIEACLSGNSDGQLIKQALERPVLARWSLARTGACVLPIPSIPEEYALGSSKQTLRRKSRSAEKAGVICRSILDLAEQRRLIALLDKALMLKSDPRYRSDNPDHSFLVGIGLWSVAYGPNGEPLVIAVIPREGAWALLRLFISLGETPRHSNARYLLNQFVVKQLSQQGIQYLVDAVSPAELTNGLRHFQRMLGFRITRVKVLRGKPMWSSARAVYASLFGIWTLSAVLDVT
jgi:hypothetical protein